MSFLNISTGLIRTHSTNDPSAEYFIYIERNYGLFKGIQRNLNTLTKWRMNNGEIFVFLFPYHRLYFSCVQLFLSFLLFNSFFWDGMLFISLYYVITHIVIHEFKWKLWRRNKWILVHHNEYQIVCSIVIGYLMCWKKPWGY